MFRKVALSGALLLAMSTSAYSATVVSFNTWLTGTQVLGTSTELARLTATQETDGVKIVFENTLPLTTAYTFDTQLLLGYFQDVNANGDAGNPGCTGGSSGCGITDITGLSNSTETGNVAVASFSNDGEFNAAESTTFDLEVTWGTSNASSGAARLEAGETSTFTLLGASLTDMFQNSGRNPWGMIHVQGIPDPNGGDDLSTKYTGVCLTGCGGSSNPEEIPLPGAALLFVSGIGSLWLTRRRRRHGFA